MSDHREITVWSHPDFGRLVAEVDLGGAFGVIVTQGDREHDFAVAVSCDERHSEAVDLGEFKKTIDAATTRLNELGWNK